MKKNNFYSDCCEAEITVECGDDLGQTDIATCCARCKKCNKYTTPITRKQLIIKKKKKQF